MSNIRVLARSHEPEAHNKALDNNPDQSGIWKCRYLRSGENRSTRRKPVGARKRTNNKLNPQMTSSPGIENGTHWWEASVLTTAPSRTEKSMWAVDKNFFWVYSLKFEDFVFFKMYDESKHSKNKFCYPGELSDAEIFASCQLTTKAQNETQRSSQMKEFTTFSVAKIEQTSGQEKNFSRWTVR